MIRSFIFGASLPFQAIRLIFKTPVLLFWSAFPVGITLTLYVFLLRRLEVLAKENVSQRLSQWGLELQGTWAQIALLLTAILVLLVGALTFSFAAGIIASPFNDILAKKTEPRSSPPLLSPPELSFAGNIRIVLIDLAKTIAASLMGIFALLVSWVPILNVVSFAIAFCLVSFQYLSYPQTRRGEGLLRGLSFILAHPLSCLGFGAVMTFFFAIPFVSSLAMPLGVVGGTLLYARAQSKQPRIY